jgi:hypothetical protein
MSAMPVDFLSVFVAGFVTGSLVVLAIAFVVTGKLKTILKTVNNAFIKLLEEAGSGSSSQE